MGILDNAKEVANAVHEIKNIELYGRVLELNSGTMDLVEENRKLHAENNELKEKFWLREKMVLRSHSIPRRRGNPLLSPLLGKALYRNSLGSAME